MSRKMRVRGIIVRHILPAAVFACFLPLTAHAGTITYDNKDGKTTYDSATSVFSLTGSGIYSINRASVTGWSLSFSTGSFISSSGSLQYGGEFAAGGTFTIKEAGVGVIFSGTFSSPVTWTLTSATTCTSCYYVLSGGLTGTFYPDGQGNKGPAYSVPGTSTQINLTSTGLYNGTNKIVDEGGVTTLTTPIPEPSSLSLLGTGLIGAGFAVKRRLTGKG